jgi:hypothetical protein
MRSVKIKYYLFCLLFPAILPFGVNASNMMAIYTYQTNGTTRVTVLHQLASIDSLKYDADSMYIYKGGITNFRYNAYSIAKIDSIKYTTATAWSDSLTPSLLVTSAGIIGDGVTNNKSKINTLTNEARAKRANLYFPDGTYLCNGNIDAWYLRFVGQSKTNTIIKDIDKNYEHNVDGADNITFLDAFMTDFYWNYASNDVSLNSRTFLKRVFNNCTFKTTLTGFTQTVYAGMYNLYAAVEFNNCDFVNPAAQYTGILLRKYAGAQIKNCNYTESGHPIYFQAGLPNAKIEVIGNTVNGGTTGIFFQGNKDVPFVGALIQGNTINNVKEEGIGIDGIGNDAGLIPVICNGTMGSITNNSKGQPVINVAAMIDSYGRDSIMNIVSSIGDLKNYYFSFGRATGQEGKYVKIADFDTINQTVTLDTVLVANAITAGGFGGIQTGFFNFHIIGNSLNNILGTNNAYGTAISVYLNVFNFLVENNTVTNCAHGINVAGGLMKTYSHTLAYNNTVRNNTFVDCDKYVVGAPSTEKGTVRFLSYYADPTTGPFQYNNSFTGNSVNYGGIYIQNQRNMTFQNNTLDATHTTYLESNSEVIK